MDSYTILCTELRGSAQSLNGNIETLRKKADKLQKAINKVTRGDYKASDLSSAYTAQTALTGSITRLGEICGAMNTAALQFSEASTELSGRANLTAYYMQHTDTLSYEGLMGTYTSAIASAGSAAAGYELVKSTLEENGYSVSNLGSVSNAVQDAIQREAEEQARRAEEAKWVKIGLTGLVIVGGIVASVVTGGAAAPIVIGAISGAVMAGGNTAIDQYAEHGWDTDNWDYAEIGKDVFVGGVTGAATAWIGGNLTKGVTNLASSTQWGSALLNSSNAYVRVGTGAFIGSASEVVSGMGSRGTGAFISTMIETDGDLGKSLSDAADYAFDGKEIAQDAVLGGLQGGKQQYSALKTEQTTPTSIETGTQKSEGDAIDWEKTSNTASEEQILREMEANGDLNIRASELSHSTVDMSVPRISEEPIELDMSFKSDKIDVDEFYSQGYMQEDALNNLTVEEYFNNYNSRVHNGRAVAGTEAQKEYRFIATEVTADNLMEANPALSYKEARELATDMYRKSAALHNPDQIAGGDPTQIYAIGGSRENSAFGALWRSGRAEQLHDKVVELTRNMTPEEMKLTRLHVKFNMPK